MASSGNNNDDAEDENASLSALLRALAVGVRTVAPLSTDDYDYLISFPDIARATNLAHDELANILQDILMTDNNPCGDQDNKWEQAADLCDTLVEQAEAYLLSSQSQRTLGKVSQAIQHNYISAYGRMLEGLVDMAKPQINIPDNDRETLFSPIIKHKHFAISPMDLTPQEGRPMDTKYGGNIDEYVDMTHLVGPNQHVPHPYRTEITTLKVSDKNWTAPKRRPTITVMEDLVGIWIDTEPQLQSLVDSITANNVKTIAVDLEAHSYRSFAGITCLMQISFKTQNGLICDYLIDTLKLWNSLPTHLAPIFANPNICKVMHGADSDIAWLQRDFGIYVVRLWDTGRAARVLKLPSAGYAHLLDSYAGIQADKTHQLSDWRQRPLTNAMLKYAIMDTHYLLDIAEMLKYDVEHHSSPEVTMEHVWEASNKVCLIRYDKELFRPLGYKTILGGNRKKTHSDLTDQQELVLKALYDWRDATARACDESAQYVCSNQALLRLALSCPKTVASLQTMFHPMPPILLQYAQDVLDQIQCATQVLTAPTSAFFKPADRGAGILSPVMGTEALYKQAGWTTPSHILGVTSTDEDEDDAEPRKLLLVDPANKEYQSGTGASHSLELKDEKPCDVTATAKAQMIRSTLRQQDMFGLISPTNTEMENDDEDDADSEESENFEIPKSMREIYKISNRNRRNKNAPSPTNVDRIVGDETMTVDTVEGAEAALGDYFSSKRQRTKDDGQKDDVSFMQEIGWLESKEEIDTLLLDQGKEELAGDAERDTTPTSDKAYDYSNVGTLGVYNATAPANPFFTGAAVSGPVSQGRGGRGANDKRRAVRGRSGRGGRGRQGERPDTTGGGKSHVYKPRK